MPPFVSIIVPVFNAEKYIANCLESLLVQTYSDFEALVINDGSKDHSGEIIQKYAAKDSRIRYFEQENQGVSATRNKGIELASGDYILFVDGDDTIDSNVLETLITPIKEKPFDFAGYCMKRIFTDGRPLRNEYRGKDEIGYFSQDFGKIDFMSSALRRYVFAVCGGLYKREILIQNKIQFFTDMIVSEDSYFAHLYGLHVSNAVLFGRFCGYNRYVYSDSCLGRNTDPWEHRLKQELIGCKNLVKYMKENKKEKLVEPLLAVLFWEFMVKFANSKGKLSPENIKEAKRMFKENPAFFYSITHCSPLRRKILTLLFRVNISVFGVVVRMLA